jgi:YHS domain-containing protein
MGRSFLLLTVVVAGFSFANVPTSAGAFSYKPFEYNTIESQNVAIHGYDPVSYFEDGRPVPGNEDITAIHGGVMWQFSSEDNRERFLAHPKRYMPMYGGYCAMAAAAGYKSDVEPDIWDLYENRLYLFYSEEAKERWDARKDIMRVKADLGWGRIKTRPVI